MPQQLDSLSPESLKLPAPVPLTLHPAGVYLSGLSEGSRRTICYSLNTIASLLTGGECDALTLDWSKLRYRHTAAVRVALLEKLVPVTANKMLSALRRVLQEAYRLDLMSADDYHRAVGFPNIEATSEPRGRSLTTSEIAVLMQTCASDSLMDIRDAAIIAILRGTGMRRSELVKLEMADFNAAEGEFVVRKGKRGKSRRVYLPQEAIAYVERWLEMRGTESGPLFCRIRRGEHLHPGQMHSDSIWRMLQKRATEAGLELFLLIVFGRRSVQICSMLAWIS